MKEGLYIHIPFCKSRCIYCGFYSTTDSKMWEERYIDSLIREMQMRCLSPKDINTIYIGGGTPSCLSSESIKRLGEALRMFDGVVEFTMECNPNDISPTLAGMLRDIGVNRVSMGVQTFSDVRLEFLKRRHRSNDIAPAVKMLRDAGIRNISIDLMFGFPNETLMEWRKDLDCAIGLNVEHISAYSLMYEEGTPLYRMREEGKIVENEEENSVGMYEMLVEKLSVAGYEHYEISNFAKPGYESKHNSSYWDGTHYIGLGAAAHSYDGKRRQWNVNSIKNYVESINNGIVPMEYEDIDSDTRYNDLVTTALRTRKGLRLDVLEECYYIYIIRNARKAIDNGLLEIENGYVRLTKKGVFVSDDVMSDLMMV